MVDLNSLIPPGSGLVLREGAFINEAGEIAGVADLANGDQHAFLFIPKEGDDDEGESEVAAQSDGLRPWSRAQGRLQRDSRQADSGDAGRAARPTLHRYRGLGSRTPKGEGIDHECHTTTRTSFPERLVSCRGG